MEKTFEKTHNVLIRFIIASILVLLHAAVVTASEIDKPITIAFDMHHVTMEHNGPTPNFGLMLSALLTNPRVEVVFFSTQDPRGIKMQLKEVVLADGRTADQVAKVYDGSYMTDLDKTERDFLGRRFKDLRVVSSLENLANTILVDDSFYKAHPSQIANLLWLHEDIGYETEELGQKEKLPVEPSVETAPQQNRRSRSLKQWIKGIIGADSNAPQTEADPRFLSDFNSRTIFMPKEQNYRADFILGVVNAAIALSDKEKISVSEALSILQWGEQPTNGEQPKLFKFKNPRYVKQFISQGQALRKVLVSASQCRAFYGR